MRVNLIGNWNTKGLEHDMNILRGLLMLAFDNNVEIRKVHHMFPQCQEAELNIFIEVVNSALFSYAAKNVWVPNLEWTYKTWIPYITMFDEVWVKTKEAEEVFKQYTQNVKRIGWTSIDKIMPEKKNYAKAIVLVGKNIYRQPKQLLKAYYNIKQSNIELYAKLPSLYIPYNSDHVTIFCPPEINDKVNLLSKELSEKEYDELLHECGLAICTSASEGFCHAVNEAMSAGCNLIVSPIEPFLELTENTAFVLDVLQRVPQPDALGTLIDVSVSSITSALQTYVGKSFKSKKAISGQVRDLYESRHKVFIECMKFRLSVQDQLDYTLADTLPKEDDLPYVSIVTLTYNRRLFMPLAKYSYMIQAYPEDKLEWVIVDDGSDPIEDTLMGIANVKYVKLDQKTSIGEKRNIGVQNAMYDMIVMMDDDDVYPNNSILHRVAMLRGKQCSFCTTIPCYDIQKYSSFMNIPPITLPMSQRVSEATLCFTREFWESKKFSDVQISEGDAFIHGREQICRELSPQDVIVSLVHNNNTSARKIPEGEPNGCHYGFNEQLFAVVSEIGEQLNTLGQKESDGGDACAS